MDLLLSLLTEAKLQPAHLRSAQAVRLSSNVRQKNKLLIDPEIVRRIWPSLSSWSNVELGQNMRSTVTLSPGFKGDILRALMALGLEGER
jgi:hypothetical protein